MADQVVRTLDEDAVTPSDRLRLIALYVLYKDGILPADLDKLMLHSQLPLSDADVVRNLDLLGGRIAKSLKDKREPPPPLFPRRTTPPPNAEEYALSRFTTTIQDVLEEHVRGTLPQDIFR
jgi:syntaxin-binding protein 1